MVRQKQGIQDLRPIQQINNNKWIVKQIARVIDPGFLIFFHLRQTLKETKEKLKSKILLYLLLPPSARQALTQKVRKKSRRLESSLDSREIEWLMIIAEEVANTKRNH